eukprot:8360716-Pyramimonas_sp.AAC.1
MPSGNKIEYYGEKTGAGGEPSTWSPPEPRRAPGTRRTLRIKARVSGELFYRKLQVEIVRCKYEVESSK